MRSCSSIAWFNLDTNPQHKVLSIILRVLLFHQPGHNPEEVMTSGEEGRRWYLQTNHG